MSSNETTRQLRVNLTDKERIEMGRQLAQCSQKLETIAEDKKAANAQFKYRGSSSDSAQNPTATSAKHSASMKLQGEVCISRLMGSGPDVIRIKLVDKSSGIHFAEAELTPHDMMMAITGRGNVPAQLEVRALEIVGATREVKTERVPFNMHEHFDERKKFRGDDSRARTKSVIRALATFEVDGWMGDASDMWNGHRRCDGHQEVRFIRYLRDGKPIILPSK